MEAHPKSCQKLDMENLFDPDAEGRSSRTVVLVGPTGVGKTTSLWKLMLDWASGEFWKAKFAYAFYISCRALNNSSQTVNLADLIINNCPTGTLLMDDILINQDNLLLILDGFDELQHHDLPSDVPSHDLHKKQPVANLLVGLLGKKILAKCHLIVATRPGALGPLLRYLRSPQCVEVLGFQPAQKEKYFQRFFEGKEDGARAIESVRSHDTLFGMCFLPILCSIISSIFNQKPKTDPLKDIPESATVTDIQLWLLLKFLECHSPLGNLEGLCRFAKDGLLHKTMVFDEEVLKEHGLETLSASSSLLLRDAHIASVYRFIYLSFQEFFAGFSFCLLDSDENTVASFQELNEIFGNKNEYSSNYTMLVRFLFGLSNKKRLGLLQERWGCKTSKERFWQELWKWVKQEAKHHSFKSREKLLELCHCIYETEDLQFATSIMQHIHDLDFRDYLSNKLDFRAVSFCLLASDSLQSFRLSDFELGPERFGQLSPGLMKPSEIQLNRCGLTAAMCKDLASIVVANPNLTSLDLSENPLDDSGVTQLRDGLLDSCCKLQSLWLHLCGLTATACTDLASVLETSQTLMDLGLGDNSLGDEGVRQLCAVLKKPHCKLRKLALSMGSLNRITKTRLWAAASVHPQMILIPYYSPAYLPMPGAEE